MSFTERARIFPPILVRLLARDGKYGKAMTTESIEVLARLDVWAVELLSNSLNWDHVPFDLMTRFLNACQLNFDDTAQMRRVDDYLRKNPNLTHIRKSPLWKSYYKPMLVRWRQSVGEVSAFGHISSHPPLMALLIRLNPLLKGAV